MMTPEYRMVLARQILNVAEAMVNPPCSLHKLIGVAWDIEDITEALVPRISKKTKLPEPKDLSVIKPEQEKRDSIYMSDLDLIDNTQEQNVAIGTQNILNVFDQATPAEVEFWSKWYRHAHQDVVNLATKYKIPVDITAAVIAVLSPSTEWRDNLAAAEASIRLAASFIRGKERKTFEKDLESNTKKLETLRVQEKEFIKALRGTPYATKNSQDKDLIPTRYSRLSELSAQEKELEGKIKKTPMGMREELMLKLKDTRSEIKFLKLGEIKEEILKLKLFLQSSDKLYKQHMDEHLVSPISSYPKNVRKAINIIDSEDISKWLIGIKVEVFYRSLLDPEKVINSAREMVIDGHAVNIWLGTKGSIKSVPKAEGNRRIKILKSYSKAASKRNTPEGKPLSLAEIQSVTWFIWKSVVDRPSNVPVEEEQELLFKNKEVLDEIPF